MNAIPRRAFRNNLQTIGHYLTGMVIVLKGVAKLEHVHEDWPYIALFFLSGGLIIVGTSITSGTHIFSARPRVPRHPRTRQPNKGLNRIHSLRSLAG